VTHVVPKKRGLGFARIEGNPLDFTGVNIPSSTSGHFGDGASVRRQDSKVVTVYYFWNKQSGPECYIAATIWDPK
jgi:hypothetical protein